MNRSADAEMFRFIGQFRHAVDLKGRISVPASFRTRLDPNDAGAFVLQRRASGSARASRALVPATDSFTAKRFTYTFSYTLWVPAATSCLVYVIVYENENDGRGERLLGVAEVSTTNHGNPRFRLLARLRLGPGALGRTTTQSEPRL